MVHRLTRISIGQTAKVLGLLYALIGLILAPFLVVANRASPDGDNLGLGFALGFPILYGVIGFVATAVGCALYNWIAGKVGGIEVSID